MARALVIKVNPYMHNESLEEIRKEVLRQYNAGGVIVISKFYEVTEVEFDSVIAEGLGECQPDTEQPKKIIYHNGYSCPSCGFTPEDGVIYNPCPKCDQFIDWEE